MPYILDEKPDLEYLAHFGVKGMKWGVRKKRNSGSILERARAGATLAINDRAHQKLEYKRRRENLKAQRQKKKSDKKKQKQLKDAQRSWDRRTSEHWNDAYNEAVNRMNYSEIAKLNKKYAKWDFSKMDEDPKVARAYERYLEDYNNKFSEMYAEEFVKMFGERPK